MISVKGIIDKIRRLPARERQIVIKHLEQMKTSPGFVFEREQCRESGPLDPTPP